MLKTLLTATVLFALAGPSAFALSDIVCDQSNMSKLERDVNGMKDAMKKDYANKELAMAKKALASNESDKCKTHMSNAMEGNDPM
ncbi:hypothetical protein PWG15_33845 (plasmid) [Ensifer adhaerens]|uniref:hypothetical protein n=1 Tax=Ensifer adhaerens TaxID=106592 RepID=UPI0023A9E821|nr:hypothetical protein [Ensifer adhaerens]WDZ81885.1 hypothetical protein PWG15_33845 [Ensifer adhaerens]